MQILPSIGLSHLIKHYLFRMHGFLKQLRPQKGSLTQCSCESGYYDQAHLIREFKHITGLTPSQYQKNTAPLATNFLQLRPKTSLSFLYNFIPSNFPTFTIWKS